MLRAITRAVVVALYVVTFACHEEITPAEETVETGSVVKYTIPAGQHESNHPEFVPLVTSQILFKAKFDSTAIYKTTISSNQEDINKLYGLSDCESFHQGNSARFGWRWLNSRLEIWAYTYYNGERRYNYIETVPLNRFNDYEIEFTQNEYIFRVNGTYLRTPRYCQGPANGYRLFPYFGGDETAPHDVTIWIEDVDVDV